MSRKMKRIFQNSSVLDHPHRIPALGFTPEGNISPSLPLRRDPANLATQEQPVCAVF